MANIYQFIFEHGSGNVTADLAFAALLLVLLVTVLTLSVLSNKVTELRRIVETIERSSQAGKMERLERSLSEFRTEVLRFIRTSSANAPAKKVEEDEAELAEPPLQAATEEKEGLEIPAPEPEVVPASIEVPQKKTLREGLTRTRTSFLDRLKNIFSSTPALSESMIDDVEAQLLAADLGPKVTGKLIDQVREEVRGQRDVSYDTLVTLLQNQIEGMLNGDLVHAHGLEVPKDKPLIALIVGVNGAGKTTSIAKLAKQFKDNGHKPMLVAADTFRAAAVDQLKTWGERLNIPVISGAENAKPQSVVFEAMQKLAGSENDVVLIDTAGRLHTKTNLMQELEGIKNAIGRHQEGAPQEVLLVVDGTTGQNALVQAREFMEVAGLTGLIVTKLDGTPKGGAVVAIKQELGIPIRFIGIGETVEDLRPFEAHEFSQALFA